MVCLIGYGYQNIVRCILPWRRTLHITAVSLLTCSVLVQTSFSVDTRLEEVDPRLDSQARDVLAGCEEEIKRVFTERFDLGVCLGVLKGLHYLSTDVCVPPALTMPDIAGVLSRYFETHSKGETADFRERSLEALRAAWPCVGRRNI